MSEETITYHGTPAAAYRVRQRPAPQCSLSTVARTAAAWGDAAVNWLQEHSEALLHSRRSDRILHEFSRFLQQTRDPAQVEAALVHVVALASGATRVELHRADGPGQPARPVACWPEGEPATAPCATCTLPISLGGRLWGTVHVFTEHRMPPTPRLLRRLTTLAVMAAAAEQALRARRGAGLASPRDPVTGLYNHPFLNALLAHAVDQAARRREPLALLYVAFDGLRQDRHEPLELADAMLQHVARAVVGTLRASDIVARLDDDRIAIVLPAAGTIEAPAVADAVRQAIAEAATTSAARMPLRAAVAVAAYPEHGETPETLHAAAAEALKRAQNDPGSRVVTAVRPEVCPSLRLAPCER